MGESFSSDAVSVMVNSIAIWIRLDHRDGLFERSERSPRRCERVCEGGATLLKLFLWNFWGRLLDLRVLFFELCDEMPRFDQRLHQHVAILRGHFDHGGIVP